MSSVAAPALFKKIVPYLKRAEELDKDTTHPESKVVAYYCRAYSMTVAMELRGQDNSKDAMGFLMALMDKLEVDKKALPAESVQPAEGQRVVADFANNIFRKADEEDQLGVADKSTARTFYAAGNFYDIMDQFPTKDPEIEKRRKFAKWKANEILTAIKEGRAPAPGGYADSTLAAAGGASGLGAEDGTSSGMGGGAVAGGGGASSTPLSPPPTYSSDSSSSTTLNIPQAPSSMLTLPLSPPPRPPGSDGPPTVPPPGRAPPPPYSAVSSPGAYPNPMAPPPPQQPQVPSPTKQTPTPPTPAAPKQPIAFKQPSSSALGRNGSGSTNSAAINDAREFTYAAIAAMQHKDTAKAVELLEKALGALRTT